MSLGTIYYIIPDIYNPKFRLRDFLRQVKRRQPAAYLKKIVWGTNRPVGGVKVHYQHVMQLREAGYSSALIQLGGHAGNFFGYDVPIHPIAEIGTSLRPEDVVVSTEFDPYDGLKFGNCTKVMFVQNWTNLRRRLKPEDRGKSYLDLGYDYIITCSDYNTSQVREIMRADSTTITNGVDQEVFHPDASLRIPGRVMCLPRKNPGDLARIMDLVLAQRPRTEFVKVHGMTQDQIAIEYRKADIFLATGYPEGFALPPLEAMNSGAVVVGFSGKGGNEYMHDRKTALLLEDGDCEGAARCLLEVLENPTLKEQLRENSLALAQTYSLAGMEKKLLDFYRRVEADRKTRLSQTA